MNNIKEYIIEKLKINSNSKVNDDFDPDRLTDRRFVLYDSQSYDNEDEEVLEWDECLDTLKSYNNQINGGFFVCRYEPITKTKKISTTIYHIDNDLMKIKNKVFTGNDIGYELRYEYGHLEFDCINSGSRRTFYIYGLSQEGYDKLDIWWNYPDELEGDTDEEKLSFLFEEGNIIPIEDK